LNNVAANVLDLLAVLRFHGDEAVSDQTAEIKRNLGAIAIGDRNWPTIFLLPVDLSRLGQRREEFSRSWNCYRVALDRLGHLIGRQVIGFSRKDWGHPDQGTNHEQ